MLCAPGLVFGDTEAVGSRFQVLRSVTRFRRYRGRRVPFSCFELPDLFLRHQGRRVPFSCFALQDSFWAVPRASGPIFMFCSPGLVFGGVEGVGYRFHVLRSGARFRGCGGRRVPFSCFALPDSFSSVPRAPCPVFIFCATVLILGDTDGVGPIFMFCPPGIIFGGTEGVGS
jgi:hypothetical protein